MENNTDSTTLSKRNKSVHIHVVTDQGKPVSGAAIYKSFDRSSENANRFLLGYSNEKGILDITLDEDRTVAIFANAFGKVSDQEKCIPSSNVDLEVTLVLKLIDLIADVKFYRAEVDNNTTPSNSLFAETRYRMEWTTPSVGVAEYSVVVSALPSVKVIQAQDGNNSAIIISQTPGRATFIFHIKEPQADDSARAPSFEVSKNFTFQPAFQKETAAVALQRSAVKSVAEQDLWTLIRANTKATAFANYATFIQRVMGPNPVSRTQSSSIGNDKLRFEREQRELTSTYGVGAYELLRTATELFLLLNCRVKTSLTQGRSLFSEANTGDEAVNHLEQMAHNFMGQNAYLKRVIDAAFPGEEIDGNFADGVLTHRAQEPCLLELIWSYWHEEGMLVQSVNALSRRFQNISGPGRDPLSHFELDPLRPLNNILWGHVQEEYRRLTVPRRNLEYGHHYGMQLIGRAAGGVRQADPRTKFLEGFHNLLHRCSQFFKEDNDTTVIADGFPLLNALKEVHMILAQGAHNQFGDLPWTARVEMLMQQWIMARTETRDFLQSRAMVPYIEAWMPQVDTMKTVQGWTDVSVSHFRDLGTYGEQLLLSIRFGDWIGVNDEDVAKSWARYWRPELQSYLHSYRAVTGVDLANPDTVDFTIPSVLLKRRLDSQVLQSR